MLRAVENASVEVLIDGPTTPMMVGPMKHLERHTSVPIAHKIDVDCSLLVVRRSPHETLTNYSYWLTH